MLVIIELMQTDLPMPVAPAISRWGILAMSKIIGAPPTSLPRQTVRRLLASLKLLSSISSRSATVETTLFGTSMPTAALPGMGASMRMPEVASDSEMSSTRLAIERTRVPASGISS